MSGGYRGPLSADERRFLLGCIAWIVVVLSLIIYTRPPSRAFAAHAVRHIPLVVDERPAPSGRVHRIGKERSSDGQ